MKPSRITTELAVDEPLQQHAEWRFDAEDRQYLDNQVRGCETHLVQSLLSGLTATWARVAGASPPLKRGDCVCLAGSDGGVSLVTKALAATLAIAGAVFGVCILPATAGGMALIAIGGALPPEITGLPRAPFATPSAVDCDIQTGRCYRVQSHGTGSYPVGTADESGVVKLTPLPQIMLLGAGAGGGQVGGDLLGTVPGNILVVGFYNRPLAQVPPNQGDVMRFDGQQWAPAAPAAGVTWAGDLAGSTNAVQRVAEISGAPSGVVTVGAVMRGVPGTPLRTGRIAANVAGGAATVVLQPAQLTAQILELTGALTQDTDVVLPALDQYALFVANRTTGAFRLRVRTANGQGVVLPRGASEWIYCDGVDIRGRPAGMQRIVDTLDWTHTQSTTWATFTDPNWDVSGTSLFVPNVLPGDVLIIDGFMQGWINAPSSGGAAVRLSVNDGAFQPLAGTEARVAQVNELQLISVHARHVVQNAGQLELLVEGRTGSASVTLTLRFAASLRVLHLRP
jgi:hypothetical protein